MIKGQYSRIVATIYRIAQLLAKTVRTTRMYRWSCTATHRDVRLITPPRFGALELVPHRVVGIHHLPWRIPPPRTDRGVSWSVGPYHDAVRPRRTCLRQLDRRQALVGQVGYVGIVVDDHRARFDEVLENPHRRALAQVADVRFVTDPSMRTLLHTLTARFWEFRGGGDPVECVVRRAYVSPARKLY